MTNPYLRNLGIQTAGTSTFPSPNPEHREEHAHATTEATKKRPQTGPEGDLFRFSRLFRNPESMDSEAVPLPDPLPDEAFHGVVGELVRTIDPHTEADPAALLVQSLAAFGSIIGRSAHFVAESSRHFLNLFTVLVGNTSKGRKGSSWAQVGRVLEGIDEGWFNGRVLSGLSSGEGLIWNVRDAIQKREPIKSGKVVTGYQDVEVDPGISDKRLFVMESEFASVLNAASRERCTLSAVIRQAWDSGNLRTLTKNTPAQATNAHISIVGHVTRDELRKLLCETDQTNGFANRFLWVCVQRSKLLPEGGNLDSVNFQPILYSLNEALAFSKAAWEIRRDDQARKLWHELYAELSEGKPGVFGGVTSRAEAQVMRLACLYAVLDSSHVIRVDHLRAGLAVWKYCEASARYIFGDATGCPVADAVRSALSSRPEGLTRTEIMDLFKNHKSKPEIDRGLDLLKESRIAHFVSEPTGGRPSQRWFLTQ